MQLLDRYLIEVRRYLPKAQQDDMIAEISDALQSQKEERESELGRPLTVDEEAAIIKVYGHPKLAASRYGKQQYLIGPDAYPFYWYTMRIVLILVLSLELAGAILAALASKEMLSTFLSGVAIMWPSIFTVFGIVTAVFVAIERFGKGQDVFAKLGTDKWNPRLLPPATEAKPLSPFQLLFDATVNVAALLWLLDFPYVRHGLGFLAVGPLVNYLGWIGFSANWHAFFTLLVASTALIVITDFVLIARPYLTRFYAGGLSFSYALSTLAACIMLTTTRNYVVIASGSHLPDPSGTQSAVNATIFICLLVMGLITGSISVVKFREFLRRPKASELNISLTGV